MRAFVVLLLIARVAHAERDHLTNRFTSLAGFGLVYTQVDRVTNGGMAVQPTFNFTFDRFELQADYLIADLKDDSMQRAGSIMHRFGFAARHQIGRVRVQGSMTIDAVLEVGIGLQIIDRDTGDVFGRSDFVAGLGARMLTNVMSREQRVFMGIEMTTRFFVTPAGDKGFVFVFGVPFGK